MALSGSVSTSAYTADSGSQWKVVLNWSATQSVTDNTSKISWDLKVSTGSGGYIVVSELRVTIDGEEVYYRDHTNHTDGYNGTKLASGTKTLSHNTDGSKSMTIKVEAGIYNWSINKSGSSTFTLDTIPRASTIGASDSNIESKSTIVVTKKSAAYTHSIAYKFGSLTGYVTADGGVSSTEVKFSASSVSFKVPTSFYAQIPNAKTGKCKLTCTTYSGSTKIGDAQTTEFTVTAAESLCKPDVSGTVVDSNNTTKNLTGDKSKLIKYYSNALCTINTTAKNSATVSTKKIGGTTVSGTTRTINAVESGSIVFSVTDSRGYSSSVTVNATLIAYVKLTVNAQLNRVGPTSGDAKLIIKGNYFNNSFGAMSNTLKIQYRIAKSGEPYGDWIQISPVLSGNSYSITTNLSGLDYQHSYSAEILCEDKLMSKTVTVTVSQGIPVFDWGENDFNFHVPIKIGDTQLTETQLKQLLSLMANIKDYLSSRIQCGWFDPGEIAANGWQDYTLTFPKPFSKSPRVLVSVYSNTTSQGYTKLAVVVQKQTETGFVLRFISGYDYTLQPTINWIAMIED